MKKIGIILSILTLTVSSYGQSTKPENLVCSDEIVIEKIYGDLNNDGIEDCIIITKQTKKEAMSVKNQFDEEVDRNRRGIVIAFKEGEYYNTILTVPDCFSSENEDGGVYFPPELYIDIERGNLIIGYAHGRYGWWKYTFRYRNNNFTLIGYDESNDFGPVMRDGCSVNFLTKKKQIQTNINYENYLANTDESKEIEEIIKETWKCIKIDNLVHLADIKDFDEFEISKYYSEIDCK